MLPAPVDGFLVIKRLILLGALALACGAGIRLTKTPVPTGVVAASAATEAGALPVLAGNGHARWEPVWSHSTPGLRSASIAADGSSIAWMDSAGSVRRIEGASGRTLWQTPPLEGINRLSAAPGGDVFVYSYLNRLNPTVRVLDRDRGADKGAVYPLDGAVWSVAVAGGGSAAFVGTGKGTVYTIPIRPTPDAPFGRPVPQHVAGIPQSIVAAADATKSLVSTWDTRTISLWPESVAPAAPGGPAPAPLWHVGSGDPSSRLTMTLSQNGATAVALSSYGPRGENPRLEVRDGATGALLWQEDYEGFGARVMVSADGRFIAVSYARMSEYNSGNIVEHKLSLYARDGAKLFGDKGGLYFSPELMAISADGERITVLSGKSTLYTLDAHGILRSKMTLPDDPNTHTPPTIRDCLPSEDGRYLLILRGDDHLTLYHTTVS